MYFLIISFLSKNGFVYFTARFARDAESAEKTYFISPLRGRQNKNIILSGRYAEGLRLINFRPLTGNYK